MVFDMIISSRSLFIIIYLLSLVLFFCKLKKKVKMVDKELSKHTLDYATLCYCMPRKHFAGGVFVTIDANHLQAKTTENQSAQALPVAQAILQL